MEENIVNDDAQFDGEIKEEKSVEEQLQITAMTLNKERNDRKKFEQEAKRLKKELEQKSQESERLRQQYELFSIKTEPTPTQDVITPKKIEPPDLGYQEAAKQVVSGLQSELENYRNTIQKIETEKNEVLIEKAIFQAFVEAGGILSSDPSILGISDPDDYPFENVKRRLKPSIKLDEDGIYIVGKNGDPELDHTGSPMTLAVKIRDLKNSMAYASCFKSDNNNTGMGSPANAKNRGTSRGSIVRPRSDMQEGKVTINEILNGTIFKDV